MRSKRAFKTYKQGVKQQPISSDWDTCGELDNEALVERKKTKRCNTRNMDLWFEWREDNNEERFSFEDSDRFEEDSLVSWNSEPESICANWRGWKPSSQNQTGANLVTENESKVDSLIEICAKTVANSIPFEAVEHSYPQIPEQIQLRIAFWSFPRVEDDIRLYCCLANGSPDEFQKGEHLVKAKAVRDALQIGFHLSATVNQQHSSVQTRGMFSVAVTFDRGHITSCNCTCCPTATWCAHIIALCLFRIHHPDQVCLRAPVSEYLSRLRRDQLQKFAQYLISELPQQILPTAQRILDELLSSQESAINTMSGAPDPTAGPAATDHNKWCMDEKGLKDNVRKMLVRFCGPVPLVFSDVSAVYMSNTAPPTAAEWSNLLRPLKGREPEGMWNLLYIVRELFHRRDSNAINLLSALTEECLANDQVVVWWFDSRSQASGSKVYHNHGSGYRNNTNAASTEATKHACAGFCDELVVLWRLAALNPKLSDIDRQDLKVWLEHWHQDAVDKARAGHGGGFQSAVSCFPGFHPAIEACSLTWGNIEISSDAEKPQEPSITSGIFYQGANNAVCTSSSYDMVHSEGELAKSTEIKLDQDHDVHYKDTPTPVDLHDIEEDLEVLCARAEALHVHGYSAKASKLAVRLAERILDSKTHLDLSTAANAHKNTKSSSFSSTTLVKAAFLCGVLAEDPHCHHLAFKVGMFGLEMPRQPAKSKALEVKLAHQESELTALLRKLPLHGEEMMVVREKANLICQGKLQRGGAVLPIMLATFIFEVLCCKDKCSKETKNDQEKKVDEDLGYMAAFCALGMRPNILESHYPILCEGIRRQRGDLAIALLDHCKDTPSRLKAVKEVLLDKSRYDGPGFVSEERQNGSRQTDTKQNENDKKADESNVRNRGGFGLPSNRHESNSQSSSYTSDSGTDSGSRSSSGYSRPRGRPAGGKTQSKFTVTVSEVRTEEESGSSSGVDTDSAVNHPSPNVSAKVVGVCHVSPRGGNNNAQSITGIRKDRKPKAANSRKVNQHTRATSDLEGSDIDVDNDELGIDSGGVALSPSTNISVKVQEITLPLQSREIENRRDSNSSGEKDAGYKESLSDSPVSSSSAIVSSGSSSGCDPPSNKSSGKNKTPLVTFKTEGLPPPQKDYTPPPQNDTTPPPVENTAGNPSSQLDSATTSNMNSADSSTVENTKQEELLPQLAASGTHNQVSTSCNGDLESVDEVFDSHDDKIESCEANIESDNKREDQEGLTMAACSLSLSNDTTVEGQPAEPDRPAWLGSQPEDTGNVSSLIEGQGAEGDAIVASGASAGGNEVQEEVGASPGRNRRYGNKKNRRKKKGKNSAVNQATEAEAHFMFELAKTVLTRAGGNSHTSVFSTPSTSSSHSGPHRGLQLCAFELGLFALGLHNRTSINWLSRTYSSHVSWISGQAMEIGSAAIQLLIERWESNLTPSEVASIADRASRSNDPTMVRAAAELGLSCLHMAHTLNPGEIQRGLLQCRDEDTQLLDRACQAVESAARGGGVYPEVLFDVARHWHYLHEQSQANTSRSHKENSRRGSQSSRPQSQPSAASSSTPSVTPYLHSSLGSHSGFNSIPPPPYQTAEQYVQTQMHQQVQHLMNQGSYNSPYRPNNQTNYGYNTRQLHGNQFQISGSYGGLPPPYQTGNPAVCQLSSRALSTQPGGQVSYYLNNAYRVGMLALESLARRTPDDRPTVKYSRNPPCSDDIRWLCSLSARLGTSYLHRFCVSALNAVVSPFVLHDLALEAARHLARSNPAQLAVNLRSPNISPLVQKCLSMYGQCIHHNLMVMAQSDHEEFVELLRHARGGFCMVPGGMSQFNELLQSIRRLYPKKKDLWQKIMTGLAKA